MNTLLETFPLGKKTVRIPVLALMMVLTILAAFFYPGSKVLFLVYGLLATTMVRVILTNRSSFFVFFLFAFLTLGCWAKLVVHFLLDTDFIEPIGGFDNSPAAWDAAITVLIITFATLLAAYALAPLKRSKTHVSSQTEGYTRFLLPLLILAIVFTVGLLYFNYYYSILKIGTEPTLKLHSYVYAPVAFMVAWGNVILLATLVYWMIKEKRFKPASLFYVTGLEGAFAAMSMGSRAQMILHVAIPFVIYLTQGARLDWKISRTDWLRIILATLFLFVLSIIVVSADRLSSFAKAVPVTSTPVSLNAAKPPSTNTKPHLEHGKSSSTVKAEAIKKYDEEINIADKQAAETQLAAATPPAQSNPSTEAQIDRWRGMLKQLTRLVVDRWIGLEGVLTVSSEKGLTMGLFRDGLNEDPSKGTNAIYQRMSNSKYVEFENFTFMTIPGPIAILLYSGSYQVLAIGLAFLFFLGYGIEAAATRLLQNVATSSAIGVALAYLMVQTNFPKALWFFIVELVLFVLGLFALKWFLGQRRNLIVALHPTTPV